MNLYISDTHFGHANAIKHDDRPFESVEEMDKCLIALWNSRVSKDDDVWIIGDFCYKSGKSPDWYLRQLKGHKHLIQGNHDRTTLDCENALKYFESIEKMDHTFDTLNGEKVGVVMCHYPMAEWYKSRHGSVLVYGHIHSNKGETYEIMKKIPRAYNAGCMINNYMPVSLNELAENNRRFSQE